MTARNVASGDPAADRRAGFAETLAGEGDLPGAIEVLQGALERVPGWAAGWYMLGDYHDRNADPEAAAGAWDRAVSCDPADRLGAGLRRDLARRVPVAETMPAAFVETLFDQYAPKFETALVDGLHYRGPDLLLGALHSAGFTRAARALDLGCGTGLAGAALRPLCDRLEGIDLSAAMLARAAAKRIYDRLDKQDIATLTLGPQRWDLILAADVFIYLGALERVIGWCAGSLTPGGTLAFTIETGPAPVTLRDSRRFAHGPDHVAALLHEAGFRHVQLTPCVLRMDRGAPVAACCVTACAPSPRLDRQGDGEETLAA